MTAGTTAFYVFRAHAANSTPKYTMPRDTSINNADMTWAADSRGIFEAGRHRTLGFGVWHHPLGSSQARLVLRADDPAISLEAIEASGTRLYFASDRRESDLWTAEVVSR